MDITRMAFLKAAASGTVLLWLQGCGGGGDSAPAPGPVAGPAPAPAPAPVPAPAPTPAPAPDPSSLQCGASGTEIAGNHGHVLVIDAADLDSVVAMSYSIAGAATHDHTVTFQPAELQQLKAGQSVTVTSTATNGHQHAVTAGCV